MQESNQIFERIAELMNKDVEDKDVQLEIEEWKNHITNNFYNCTPKIFSCLGQMYVYDKRFTKNIDKTELGLSSF